MRTITRLLAVGLLSMQAVAADSTAPGQEPPPTPPPEWKRLRKARRNAAMRYYWYMAGAILATWILMRGLFALRRRLQPRPKRTSRVYTCLTLRPLSIPYFPAMTVSELFLVTTYTVGTFALSIFGSYFGGVFDYANPTGMVAVAQLPLIVGLVGRNNTLSKLTGISYDHINYLHRTSGRVCFAGGLAHTFGWWLHKGLGKHAWTWRVYTAIPAMAGLTALTLFSFRTIRNRYHQLFRDVHIAAALMFLIMTWFHTPEYRSWVVPALLLWSLDRLAGFARICYVYVRGSGGAPTATVELIDDDVLRLTVPVPFKWKAGMHAYIGMPSVSEHAWEQHPFTFANIPTGRGSSPATFVLRVHGGFTHRLRQAMTLPVERFPMTIEGPYGEPLQAEDYDSLLLIAGGSGITLCLSHFLDAIAKADRGGRHKTIRLVWNTRRLVHVRAIAPLLEAAIDSLSNIADITIRIDIHITRSHASDEPADPNYGIDALAFGESKSPGETSPLIEHLRHLRGGSTSSYGSSRASIASNSDGEPPRLSPDEQMRTGIGPATMPHTCIHFGRSLVTDMIRDEAAHVDNGGRLGVVVCGPPTLTLDSRLAVNAVVPEARAEITFHSGSFCF